MPAKIVIKDATREQTIELEEPGKVLGREPGCDLQFLDGKLSRRHAQFEVSAQGVRLIDLGTTNGSFVNGQRVTEAWLKHGDKIHLGNLDITFLSEVPPVPQVPTTPSQPPTPAARAPEPELRTVFIDAQKMQQVSESAPSPTARIVTGPPEEPRTMVFDPHRMQQISQQPSPVAPPSGIERSTQVLGAPASAMDGGRTVALGGPIPGETVPLAAAEAPETLAPVVRDLQKRVIAKVRFPTMAWRMKFVLMLALMIAFLMLVITVPLLMIQEKATVRISLDRGIALANSLAAKNRFAVVTNQPLQLDTEFIAREPGVVQAVVMDGQGRILSPAARAGQVISSIEGIDPKPQQIKVFYDGLAADGNYNFVSPIKNDNAQTVGLAWITFDPVGLSESAASLVVVLMLVVFLSLLGGATMVWAATNMTVRPVVALRDATESVIKGDAVAVEELAGFAEVNDLAKSINRLIERGGIMPSGPEISAVPPPAYTAPAPQTVVPSAFAAAPGGGDAGELVVDGNFTVVRVSGHAEQWLGARASDLVGRHVIEAVHEQALLEVILDLVNTLTTQPNASQESDFSSIASLGGVFVLSGSKLPTGDQTVIRLEKK